MSYVCITPLVDKQHFSLYIEDLVGKSSVSGPFIHSAVLPDKSNGANKVTGGSARTKHEEIVANGKI